MARRFALDFDGTLVTDSWPAVGEWMPGAIEYTRKLTELGEVVVYTCRIAPCEPNGKPRTDRTVEEAIAEVRNKLDEAGLHEVGIWAKPYKPPADCYVDNKAIHYNGRKGAWKAIYDRIAATVGIDAHEEVSVG